MIVDTINKLKPKSKLWHLFYALHYRRHYLQNYITYKKKMRNKFKNLFYSVILLCAISHILVGTKILSDSTLSIILSTAIPLLLVIITGIEKLGNYTFDSAK